MKYLFSCIFFTTILLSSCSSGKKLVTSDDLRHTTTIILVRHAEKADDGTSDPGLTPLGRARAQKLAAMLAPTGVTAVFSTPYQRTRLTARPLAEQENLNIQEYAPHNEQFPLELISEHEGETVLVVGHSNTIPSLVNSLTGNTAYEQLNEMEYDKLFVVQVIGRTGRAMVFSF